jgi:hypothetical protein
MKRTDLYRLQGLKIASRIKPHGVNSNPGGAASTPDKREQRRLDQAAGLIPFACKLNADLVKQVQMLAQTRGAGLNETLSELLIKGLAAGAETSAAEGASVATASAGAGAAKKAAKGPAKSPAKKSTTIAAKK